MIYDVIYVKKDETVRDLLKKLVKHKIGGVPVVDQTGNLAGMISDGDVIRALSPQEKTIIDFYSMVFLLEKQKVDESIKKAINQTVDKIMTNRRIHYVYPDDDFETALTILSRHHYKKIPVINRAGRVVGVISRGDAIRFINQHLIENENNE